MKRLLLELACAGVAVACLPLLAQTTDTDAGAADRAAHARVVPLAPVPVPGTSATTPFTSFDIIYVDPKLQLVTLSSRSSKVVAIYNALTDEPIGETPAVFAGVGSDNAHSGPDGNVVAGLHLWAGDANSIVRVFDLRADLAHPPQIAAISTGGTLRADEMDFDPKDNLVAVLNTDVEGNSGPPFVSLISNSSFEIQHKIVFDGTHGTPDASVGGLGAALYDSATGKFLISVPEVGNNVTEGAVAVLDPVSGEVQQVFYGLNNCQPSGMAQGPRENVLVGCDPGFPAPDPTLFPARTYVINGRTGAIVADITQVGGEDEVWYNPGDGHYYTGSRDFFTNPAATAATPVLGVIDAYSNQWIENVPTGKDAHSVAANPVNNHIFVPLEDPNPLCGNFAGCVEVFTDTHDHHWF